MKIISSLLIASFLIVLFPIRESKATCWNGSSYSVKGYMEDSSNNPVTGKTLSTVLFDFFYDDGTSSTGNAATAEMGQGWYRYSYSANGKNGIWIMRDSGATYKNFPGGILENLCDHAGGYPQGSVATANGSCNNGINGRSSFTTTRSEASTDYWKNALLVFTSGSLINQAQLVTGYSTTGGCFIVSGFTAAPSVGDNFILVNK